MNKGVYSLYFFNIIVLKLLNLIVKNCRLHGIIKAV